MKIIKNKRLVVMLLSITAIVIIASSFGGAADQLTNEGKISLVPPSFLISAQAASNNEIADRLDDEAGISAYFETTDTINLNNAASAYRVIETQTAEYIIGSVHVPGYEEHYDAHVYVHTDGWILAYYNKEDSIAKIIDIEGAQVSTTNLNTVVSEVASAAGVPFSSVNYYDFRYPNATHILMVGENDTDGTCFTITLPSSYGYYERGWARDYTSSDVFRLDGVNMPRAYYFGSPYYHAYGIITASQLLPDIEHTVCISTAGTYGVLIIIYREG